MRSVIQKSFGGPDVLEVTETERPHLYAGNVLVRVHAAGVNPVDAAVRSGTLPLLGEPPYGVGWDISGVVEEAAPGARFAVGDEVFGLVSFPRAATGYAEYVAASSRELARKPAALDHVHAAALPLSGLTAWHGLVDAADVKAGQRVLITRAAGGVGHLAVQLAKARGAHVTALASAPRHDFVRALGADEVIDYRTTDFTEMVRDADVVLDSLAQADRSASVLRPGGVLISILQHYDREVAAEVAAAGRVFAGVEVRPDAAGLESLAALVAEGRLRPHVSETFPLAEAAKAHELIESGQVQGKIALTV
ncbi:NADP-dependent oxidoreductase [Streptomyces sp. A7024]|uniref:NADP-dependent oxidoreductase n=1 Tax=Streptomyces coryli TaxID=1128680 RepID=A0A6G4TYW9_9ACTN|nr:NADP-dependent oxidoreductase [Streptomyces coryli]NGN64646.1 NADP-dependent oxidoreductase [Streptomyces coryli]